MSDFHFTSLHCQRDPVSDQVRRLTLPASACEGGLETLNIRCFLQFHSLATWADSRSPQCLWQSRTPIIKRVPTPYWTLWAPETGGATLEHSMRYLIWTNLQNQDWQPCSQRHLSSSRSSDNYAPGETLSPDSAPPEAKALAHSALSQAETPCPLGYRSCSVSTPTLQKSNRQDASVSRQSSSCSLARMGLMNLLYFYYPGSTIRVV